MPRIYKPLKQLIYPNDDILSPAEKNIFSAVINGQTCIAYRVSFFDMNNNQITTIPNERINLSATKYNGEKIEYELSQNLLSAGNEYKWSIDLYGNDVSGVITKGIVTSQNHNFDTGDVVYISTSSTNSAIPSALSSVFSKYKPYYVSKLTKDTFTLHEYLEGARNAAGNLGGDITSPVSINISSVGISEQCVFKAYSKPSASLSSTTITSQSYTFTPEYSQAEGLIINSYEFVYYSDFNTTPISSGEIFSSNVKYTLDGLLSGYTYYVKFILTNTIGQKTEMDYTSFPVLYNTSSLGVVPTVSNNSENSCIDVSWGDIVQLTGSLNSGAATYVDNYKAVGNKALKLSANQNLTYSGIQCRYGGSLPMFNWEPLSDDWSGDIFKISNSQTGEYTTLKYENDSFILVENGVSKILLTKQLGRNSSYYIGIANNEMYLIPNDESFLSVFGYKWFG